MTQNAGNDRDERRMETMKVTDQQNLRFDTYAGKLTQTPPSVELIRRLIRRLQRHEGTTQRAEDSTTRATSRPLSAVLKSPLDIAAGESRR